MANPSDAVTDQQIGDVVSSAMRILQSHGMTRIQAAAAIIDIHSEGIVLVKTTDQVN